MSGNAEEQMADFMRERASEQLARIDAGALGHGDDLIEEERRHFAGTRLRVDDREPELNVRGVGAVS